MFDDQTEFNARFEWGDPGLRRLARHADVVVVVDVLSFVTAVDIAVARGATVYPSRERGEAAASFARRVGAIAAADRNTEASSGAYSLSPASLLAIPPGTRIVLPSPNGATLLLLAADLGTPVLAGCLRNATATAAACRALGGTVAVIAAGERRVHDAPDSLRFAVEDLLGAGAILNALSPTRPSPEAATAIAAFRALAPDLGQYLATCASGKELRERGFAADVELAAQLDASQSALRLENGAFAPESGKPRPRSGTT